MLAVARAAIVLTVLGWIPGLLDSFEPVKAELVRVAGFAALASALVSNLPFGRTPRGGPWVGLRLVPLDVALIAWLAIEVVATGFSVDRPLSLFGEPYQREGLLTSIGLVGIYVAARLGTRTAVDARATSGWLLAAAALASTYALIQAIGLDPLAWSRSASYASAPGQMRPIGTLGHPNLLGVVTAAAAAAALARLLSTGRSRGLDAAALGLALAATLVTLSRGAWLAALAGLGMAAALAARQGAIDRATRGRLLIGVGAIGAFTALLALTHWGPAIGNRLHELFAAPAGSARTRLEIWKSAIAAWRARPLWGHGPDAFNLVFPSFQTPECWGNEWGATSLHAHSIYLHTLATRGLLGAAAAAAAFVAFVRCMGAAWRDPEEREAVKVWAPVAAALAVAGAFGALGVSGAVLAMVAAGSIASGRAEGGRAQAPRSASASVVAGLVAAALAATYATGDLVASAKASRANGALEAARASAGEPSREARARALEAARGAYDLRGFEDLIARTCSEAWLGSAADEVGAGNAMNQAELVARRAVSGHPLRAANHEQLGRVRFTRAALGDSSAIAEAEAEFDRCIALAPRDGIVLVEYARLELALGRPHRAVALARRAGDLYPTDAEARLVLAGALQQTGDIEGAALEARRALDGDWHGEAEGRGEAARFLESLERARAGRAGKAQEPGFAR